MRESGEMYLETILILYNRRGYVSSIDVAEEMQLSRPSVSRGMSKLRENGCILMDAGGMITLTEKGKARACELQDERKVKLDQLFSPLTEEEQKELFRLLNKLQRRAED